MASQKDVISEILGDFGKWQLRIMLIIFLCKLPTSWFMAVIICTAPLPNPGDFYCRPPEIVSREFENEWISIAHPTNFDRKHNEIVDYCHVFRDVYERPLDFIGPNKTQTQVRNLTVIECNQFSYNDGYHSLVADFDLVCKRQILLPVTQCAHIFGLLVGGIIAHIFMKL